MARWLTACRKLARWQRPTASMASARITTSNSKWRISACPNKLLRRGVDMIASNSRKSNRWVWLLATILLTFSLFVAVHAGFAAAKDGGEDAAVKDVVAGFSNGWNSHDAHAMCASLADDVRWVSWRGEVYSSREEVESVHAKLFA